MTGILPYSDLIRELRQQLDLSQEKFAAKLGVSLRTIYSGYQLRAIQT
ncbi:helix-turn-helix domain-containing protein [Nostoc sp. 'Lobaria pulmonaria (5183) cyanobiont']|nr:helix-turn-helix domain-containing protein [Nostoc sp. 'Lobaria pulmonaria (5183) cyanobiont']